MSNPELLDGAKKGLCHLRPIWLWKPSLVPSFRPAALLSHQNSHSANRLAARWSGASKYSNPLKPAPYDAAAGWGREDWQHFSWKVQFWRAWRLMYSIERWCMLTAEIRIKGLGKEGITPRRFNLAQSADPCEFLGYLVAQSRTNKTFRHRFRTLYRQ